MPDLLREYLPILIFIGLAFGLALVIVLASLIAGPSRPDPEKTSAYECGFNAFDDSVWRTYTRRAFCHGRSGQGRHTDREPEFHRSAGHAEAFRPGQSGG